MERHQSKELDVPYVDSALISILVPRVVGFLRDCAGHFPTLLLRSPTSGCCSWQLLLQNLDLDDDADLSSLVQLSLSAIMALVTIGRGVGTPAMNALGLTAHDHAAYQLQVSVPARRTTTSNTGAGHDALDRLQRVAIYIVLSGFLPVIYRLARKRWDEDEDVGGRGAGGEGTLPLASQIERIATSRRRKVRNGIIKFIGYIVPPARLVNHLLFISGGGTVGNEPSAPPTLPMRLAGLTYTHGADDVRQTAAQRQQHINYAYAYRRVLYEQAFSLAVMMAPVARQMAALLRSAMESSAQYKERMKQFFQTMIYNSGDSTVVGDNDRYLTSGVGVSGGHQCKICHADPVTIPYVSASSSGGREVFCYYCIRLALLDTPNMQKSRMYCRQQ